MTLFFDTTGTASASTTFSVQVSADGTNWVTYNKLVDNVANTNAQNITRVSSALLSATSTKTYAMDLSGESYYLMRCVTVAGSPAASASCTAIIKN